MKCFFLMSFTWDIPRQTTFTKGRCWCCHGDRGGKVLIQCRCILSDSCRYPKEHGIVTSWGDREAVGKNVYDNDLKMKSSEQTVILTEAPLNPLVNREKTAELFPEHAEVPALCVCPGCVRTLVLQVSAQAV